MEEIGSEPEQHAPPSSFSQGMVAPFHASCTLHDVSVTQVRLAGQEDGCAYMAAYSARETACDTTADTLARPARLTDKSCSDSDAVLDFCNAPSKKNPFVRNVLLSRLVNTARTHSPPGYTAGLAAGVVLPLGLYFHCNSRAEFNTIKSAPAL